jgi:hypothetical protein
MPEAAMNRRRRFLPEVSSVHRLGASTRRARSEAGQIIVIAALAMVAIIGGVALVLEGGNAYANQRIAQNAADAIAHAGATVLAQRLGGTAKDDDDVAAAVQGMADANGMASHKAYYVNVLGQHIAATGLVATSPVEWVEVGSVGDDLPPPPKAQGVQVNAVRNFGTTFGRVLGINSFDAGADATAVMGRLTGGSFMPMVLPVSPSECSNSGFLQPFDDPTKPAMWYMSNPGTTHPTGTEYVVPLCKTGGGSFMFLDLDPTQDCGQEVLHPPAIQFDTFPVDVDTDTGGDCQKKVAEAVDAGSLQGKVVLIPVCDNQCVTGGGSNAKYHIIRIAAFYVDFMSWEGSNSHNNKVEPCERTTSPTYGTTMVPFVSGNGSDGCIAGWFVRYITAGPVGSLDVYNGEAIGVQLIK